VSHDVPEVRHVGAAAAPDERDLPPPATALMPETIAVLVAAPVRLYRDALAAILAQQEGIEVAGIAGDGGDTLVRWLELAPDIVLVDLALEGSVETIRWLAARGGPSGAGVVVLASSDAEDRLVGCAQAEVFDFITRDASIADLARTLRRVALGEARIAPETAAAMRGRLAGDPLGRYTMPERQRLTPRETEVLRLIEQGLSNKEIAHRLSVALSTVKQHVHHILEKLEVSRRGEAVARLQRSRLSWI
jgi:DNA-binding NarL/FixJ family response regulator